MKLRLASVGLLAFTGGVTIGYIIAWKRIEGKYAALAEEEIAEARRFYSVLHKKDELSDPTQLVVELTDPLSEEEQQRLEMAAAKELIEEKLGYTEVVEESTEVNVFTDVALEDEENWIWEEELKNRGDTNPYVITYDEFHNQEENFTQVTLTYFEGDDILCDDRNEIVADVDGMVGDENLKRFGHASRDNNIVLIRNPRLEMEFEVVRSPHEYTKDVLGFVEHSDPPRHRRFRRDDE